MIASNDKLLSDYLRAIERFPPLDAAAERDLARRARDGDAAAGHRLIEANLRYVARIAIKYKGYGFRLADLVAEGNLGLLRAIRRYDPERQLRFMTYAAYWVRAMILGYVLKHWSIVGMGSGPLQSKLFFRLKRERGTLTGRLGEGAPGVDTALALHFDTSEETIRSMSERISARDTSLDAPAFLEGATTLVDLLPDDHDSAETETAEHERDAAVKSALGGVWESLSEREQLIVSTRLLRGDEGVTLADLGRQMGVSRERVRQLEERLKSKLKQAFLPLDLH